VNSLPKTVTRQRRDCDWNSGPSAPESSMLTTRLPNHPSGDMLTQHRQTDRHYRNLTGTKCSVGGAAILMKTCRFWASSHALNAKMWHGLSVRRRASLCPSVCPSQTRIA